LRRIAASDRKITIRGRLGVKRFWFVFVLVTALAAAARGESGKQCAALAHLKLDHASVTAADLVASGALPIPAGSQPQSAAIYQQAPAFCRVKLVSRPTTDSDIKIEVWLPAAKWNGKYRGVGNGGFAGEIYYTEMAAAVGQGYAVAGTNTGHAASGNDAAWALGHPEKVADFGWRGIHEMTVKAKVIIEAFYGSATSHSYFSACSDGGREALMEAQRFPNDYDGILAGAPANYWTNLVSNAVLNAQATTLDPASYIPASKLPAITAAVNAACDKNDGVKDGVLNDPPQCHFEPASMLCHSSDETACLTQLQVAALKQLYGGARGKDGKLLFPGYLPGAEDGPGGWGPWITGNAPGKSLMFAFGAGYYANMVYGDPNWDYRTFELDRDLAAAQQKTAQALNSVDPNLKPFAARGGKLIVYHGWNDPAISALNTVNYYQSVAAAVGGEEEKKFVRLYMVPGMQHCNGGPGADSFDQFGLGPRGDAQHDAFTALEDWVEKGAAPSSIVAAKYVDGDRKQGIKFTRPLCAYPEIARYKGSGDTNDAASFACAEAKQ
jgi:hypothetical protein